MKFQVMYNVQNYLYSKPLLTSEKRLCSVLSSYLFMALKATTAYTELLEITNDRYLFTRNSSWPNLKFANIIFLLRMENEAQDHGRKKKSAVQIAD